MNQGDAQSFFALVADVSAFYKQDYSDFAANVWWQAMKPFDFYAVSDAFNRHCVNPDTGQFMPKPADIVKMLQGTTQDSGLVAWSKLDKAVRSVGPYQTVAFDDPIIHRVVVEMGGWVAFGTKNDDEWPFVRNEFVNRYRGYKMRNEIPEHAPKLIGIAEAENLKNGFAAPETLLLGNPEKASETVKSGTNRPLLEINVARHYQGLIEGPSSEQS